MMNNIYSKILQFVTDTFARVGLGDRWTYYDAQMSQWHEPCAARILEVFKSADLFLNVSGADPLRSPLMQIPVRVFIDTDPAFTQVRHLTNTIRRNF